MFEISKWRFYINNIKKTYSDDQTRFVTQIWWKNKDFYCYLLLAAENLLLAEQLQISACSSASKLPACANTNWNSSKLTQLTSLDAIFHKQSI